MFIFTILVVPTTETTKPIQTTKITIACTTPKTTQREVTAWDLRCLIMKVICFLSYIRFKTSYGMDWYNFINYLINKGQHGCNNRRVQKQEQYWNVTRNARNRGKVHASENHMRSVRHARSRQDRFLRRPVVPVCLSHRISAPEAAG